jgi:rhodanese-related sulfurtransferase
MQHAPLFLRLCQEAQARITEVSAAELTAGQLPGNSPATSYLLLDVREDHEWEKGHLPGAEHLGRGILERDIERIVPSLEAPVVLYCGGGFRSALAADSLQRMGYRHVYSLAGGYRGWLDAGRPVVTTKVAT